MISSHCAKSSTTTTPGEAGNLPRRDNKDGNRRALIALYFAGFIAERGSYSTVKSVATKFSFLQPPWVRASGVNQQSLNKFGCARITANF